MNGQMKRYRVWMNDGCASLQTAWSEDAAKQAAIDAAVKSCEGAAMTAGERKQAMTVDYADCLSTAARQGR